MMLYQQAGNFSGKIATFLFQICISEIKANEVKVINLNPIRFLQSCLTNATILNLRVTVFTAVDSILHSLTLKLGNTLNPAVRA